MTEKENLGNMRKCPSYRICSVPRCQLDFWANKRVKWKDEKICANWRYVMRKRRTNMTGRRNPKLKKLILEIEAKRMAEKGARKG